jgi:predicted glycosyltransferase involved in capsule biosynthesis
MTNNCCKDETEYHIYCNACNDSEYLSTKDIVSKRITDHIKAYGEDHEFMIFKKLHYDNQ